MSASDELLALAEKVVAGAGRGEQVEAYVSRGGETDIRVYQGELEHFVSAQSEGIGVRVINGGRTGFAYAGVLDEAAVAEVLAEARANAEFGTPDEWAGLAEPDGVAVTPQTLWNDALSATTTDRKVALAKQLEQLTLAADPRVRVESANYSDGWGEAAVATSTGIRASGRENGCFVSVGTLADDGGETQSGFGFAVGRVPDELDVQRAADDGADRATRLLGATKPPSTRSTIVLDPYVTAQFIGIISATLNGEAVVKGRSVFADRVGSVVAAEHVHLVDDPTNPLAYTATDIDGEGLAARRNHLIEGGVLQQFVHNSYSARRAGTVSTGNAVRGGFKGTPGVGCLALQLTPGVRTQAELVASVGSGILIQSVKGMHSGVNPIYLRQATSSAAGLHDQVGESNAALVVIGSSSRSGLGRVLPGGTAERLLSGAPVPVAVAPNGYAGRKAAHEVIGVGFDQSPESRKAVGWAAALASRSGASLRLFAVYAPLAFGNVSAGGALGMQTVDQVLARERQVESEELTGALSAEVSAESHSFRGDPAKVLVEQSQRLGLLVLGSRGYGPLKSVLLGSVSSYVIRNAYCPVLVVPRGAGGD